MFLSHFIDHFYDILGHQNSRPDYEYLNYNILTLSYLLGFMQMEFALVEEVCHLGTPDAIDCNLLNYTFAEETQHPHIRGRSAIT